VFGTVPHSAALVDICPSSVEIIQLKSDARGARRGHLHDFLKCKITASLRPQIQRQRALAAGTVVAGFYSYLALPQTVPMVCYD
jgi:hypothetical protein